MTLFTYDTFLPDAEKVGRMVPNAFAQKQTIILPASHWKHYDFLSAQGIDMALWTREADICRHRNGYRSRWKDALAQMLMIDERRRFFANLECPLFINENAYNEPSTGWPQNIEIFDRLPIDNEIIEHRYESAIGVEIPVHMRGKYWRYLGWLCELGGAQLAQEWVTYADFDRSDPNLSVGEKLEMLLGINEENHYLDYEGDASLELPLLISPIGYLNVRPLNKSTRELEDSTGTLVPLELSEKSWKQYDWLESKGLDVKQFVKDVDKEKRIKERPSSMYVAVTIALQKECNVQLEVEKNAETP